MAKAKKKQKPKNLKAKRLTTRTHSTFDNIPSALYGTVVRMIIDNEWPTDFKGETKGKPRYKDIARYCKQRGFPISESAAGRLGIRMRDYQKKRSTKTEPSDLQVRLLGYMADHLAEVARDFTEIREQLLEHEMHESRKEDAPMTKERMDRLTTLCIDDMRRMSQIINDCFSLTNAFTQR